MLFTNFGGATLKGLVAFSIAFGATTSASANACQAGPGGCLLPIADAPPPPPPVESAPPVADAGPVIGTTGRGFPLLALLAGVAALALLAYFLLDNDEEEEGPPVSP
jgi:hypothetical protein